MKKRKQRNQDLLDDAENQAANHVLFDLDGSETDSVIAKAIADYLIAAALMKRPTIRIFVSHDKRLVRRGVIPPFPLPFDWKQKGCVGIRTKSRETAHDWCMKALFFGYPVFECWHSTGCAGGGMGAVSEYRQTLQRRTAIALGLS
jgi:hypothetical protein